MRSPLEQFACPVCGRIRPLARSAANSVLAGRSSGECRIGEGCNAKVDQHEHFRRFWLQHAGVTEIAIRAAGGARAYVLAHGLPAGLQDLADVMPTGAPVETRTGRWRKPVQAAA